MSEKSFEIEVRTKWRSFADDEPECWKEVCIYVPSGSTLSTWNVTGLTFGVFAGYGYVDEDGDPVLDDGELKDDETQAIFSLASFDDDRYPAFEAVEQEDFGKLWWMYVEDVFPFTKGDKP